MRYEKLIDHTGIADPVKRTIPAEKPTTQHSPLPEGIGHTPLPWSQTGNVINHYCERSVNIAKVLGLSEWQAIANAKLIVASVNHAAKLAEALRGLANIATHPKCTKADRALFAREARQALAAWEGAQ